MTTAIRCIAWVLILSSVARADTVSDADAMVAAGDPRGALAAYKTALGTNANNVAALIGLAAAHKELDEIPQAVTALQRAAKIAPRDRVVVNNLAILLHAGETKPQAVKLVADYLVANPQSADEPALDLLLHLIDSADDETRKSPPYVAAQAAARTYTSALESRRPGLRRWGGQWIDSEAFARQEAESAAARKEIERLDAQIQEDERALAHLEEQSRGGAAKPALKKQIQAAEKTMTGRSAERERVRADLPTPPPIAAPVWLAFGTPAPALERAPQTEVAATGPDGVVTGAPPAPTDERPSPRVDLMDPDADLAAAGEKPRVTTTPPAVAVKTRRVSQQGVAFAVSEETLVVPAALVAGATEVVVKSSNGASETCDVIRVDAAGGIALLKLKTLRAAALSLAADFAGGAVECVGVIAPDLFTVNATTIEGTAPKPAGGAWVVALGQNPRLPGAPLVVDGRVVGVTLAARDTDAAAVPAVTLTTLRNFLGPITPGRGATDPKQAIFQITTTRDVPVE
ncbi:MAG TPA: tetratricopeptide repeat protein [Tepidisphaeraceae bacterium]